MIQLIPYDDTSKPMFMSIGGIIGVVPIVGGFGFICGLALATYDHDKYKSLGFVVAVLSFVIMIGGAWVKERVVRHDWDFAPGRCVDRELQKIWIQRGPDVSGGHWGWFWRIVCEYEYLGIRYRVTPEVYWTSFSSEDAALKFLAGRISPDGKCTLRVNPKNLLRTDLMEQRSKLEH